MGRLFVGLAYVVFTHISPSKPGCDGGLDTDKWFVLITLEYTIDPQGTLYHLWFAFMKIEDKFHTYPKHLKPQLTIDGSHFGPPALIHISGLLGERLQCSCSHNWTTPPCPHCSLPVCMNYR